jgi:predicted ribosomally synthesized peptide with SipW-like signal peptide
MKKLLFVLMAVVLCLGLVGGAFAYFSDTGKSEGNTFTAGTLDLALEGSSWYDNVGAKWTSPASWAPGDKTSGTLNMRNFGTVDIGWIGIKPVNLQVTAGPTDYPEKIIVNGFSMHDSWTGKDIGTGNPENFADFMATWGIWGTTAPLTLAEFASGTYYFYTEPTDWLLKALQNGTTSLTIEFQFDPDAGNTYQGAVCSFDLQVVVVQNGAPMPNFTHVGDAGCGYGPGE